MSGTAQRFDGMDAPTAAVIVLEGLDRVSGKLGVDVQKAASVAFGMFFEAGRYDIAAEVLRQALSADEGEIHDIVEEACRKTGRNPGAVFWAIWGEILYQRPAPRRSDAL